MTRAHFIAFAGKINQLVQEAQRFPHTDHHYSAIMTQAHVTAEIVIEVAREFNPRFDAVRFMKACGLERSRV